MTERFWTTTDRHGNPFICKSKAEAKARAGPGESVIPLKARRSGDSLQVWLPNGWNEVRLEAAPHKPTGRYFTKALLVQAAQQGGWWGYNRQLALDRVLAASDKPYPVLHLFDHHHRDGQPCEKHIRCTVELEDGTAFVDVPTEFFEALPIEGLNQ